MVGEDGQTLRGIDARGENGGRAYAASLFEATEITRLAREAGIIYSTSPGRWALFDKHVSCCVACSNDSPDIYRGAVPGFAFSGRIIKMLNMSIYF